MFNQLNHQNKLLQAKVLNLISKADYTEDQIIAAINTALTDLNNPKELITLLENIKKIFSQKPEITSIIDDNLSRLKNEHIIRKEEQEKSDFALKNQEPSDEALTDIANYVSKYNADLKITRDKIIVDSKEYLINGNHEERLNYAQKIFQVIEKFYHIAGKKIFTEHFSFDEKTIELPSMVLSGNKIGLDSWRLTILRHSDVNQVNKNKIILVMEKRSIFGDLLVVKFDDHLLTEYQIDIMMDIRNIRRNIFGKPTDLNKDSIYYATSLIIEQAEKEILCERIKIDQRDLIQTICRVLENNIDIQQSMTLPWYEYIKDRGIFQISHNELIDYSYAVALEDVRDQVGRVESKVEEIDVRVKQVEEKFVLTEQQISNIQGSLLSLQISQESSKALIGKISAALEQTSSFETISSLTPYQASLYNSLKWQLNCVYTAASAVQTEILQNSKTGTIGKVGNILQAISSNIPMVGAGVQFFGAVLNLVDSHQQNKMVANFANLVNGPVAMDDLASRIAIAIATSKLDREKLSNPSTILDKCIEACNSLIGIIAFDPSTLETNIEMMFADQVVGMLIDGEVEEEQQVKLGKSDANLIASMLINKIYSGDNIKQFENSANIKVLVDYIKQELGLEVSKFGSLVTETDQVHEVSAKISAASLSSKATILDNHSKSEELAAAVLARVKLLLKASEFPSDDHELEREFIFELAKLFIIKHTILLESAFHNDYLRTDLINKLANEFKKSKKIYQADNKLYIQEELREDSDEFLNPVIEYVKDILKQNTYKDSVSGVNLEIRYVNQLVYHNPILNHQTLLDEARVNYGMETFERLISLGEDLEVANGIIASADQYGAKHVVDLIFGNNNGKNDVNSAAEFLRREGLLIITDETQQNPGSIPGSHKFVTQDNFAITAFAVKEAIEALSTIKYFAKEILQIKYDLPEFIDNNYFKLTAHFVATNIGAYSLIGKLSIVSSLLPTAVYGGKVLAYEYLSQQKQLNFEIQEDKSIDSLFEFTQKCGFDIAAQTALGIVSSFVSGSPAIYDMAISATIGGMQCYSQYNHKQNIDPGNIISTGEKIIPYTADTVTYYIAINNMQFDLSSTAGQMLAIKQGFAVLSSVVMSDYITKLAISSIPDGYFNCQEDGVLGRIYTNFGWECSNDEV